MYRMLQEPTKSILMVLSDPATSPVTGWPVGFWWAELSHAWLAFREAGYAVTLCSPRGGDLRADAWSDPDHESGYAAWDIISKGFKDGATTRELIHGVPALGALDPERYDAMYLVGGQGPMVTWMDDTDLHDTVARFYESGRPTAVICHGTCLLLKARLSNGDLMVTGKTWTGFANSEERYSEDAAGQKIQPFWIEREAQAIEDTNFIVQGPQEPHAVRDGNLITGQQNMSGAETARRVIEALGV